MILIIKKDEDQNSKAINLLQKVSSDEKRY